VATLSLVPQVVGIALYAGDGAALRITVRDVATPPAPIDLTGTVRAQVRASRPDVNPLLDFAVDTSDAANGVVVLTLTGDQTASLLGGTEGPFSGYYDVEWTPAGAEPVTLVQGDVSCVLDVTRNGAGP